MKMRVKTRIYWFLFSFFFIENEVPFINFVIILWKWKNGLFRNTLYTFAWWMTEHGNRVTINHNFPTCKVLFHIRIKIDFPVFSTLSCNEVNSRTHSRKLQRSVTSNWCFVIIMLTEFHRKIISLNIFVTL